MGNYHPFHIGIDIGSTGLKTAVIDADKNILYESYCRIKGKPAEALSLEFNNICRKFASASYASVTFTGSLGKEMALFSDKPHINEVITWVAGISHLYPDARTVIEMGGTDSKLLFLTKGYDHSVQLADVRMNNLCAAGTGSFLDQQASRLELTIEEFGEIGLKSENPPRIAGRCSVFAKSDMIHLQQIATPDYDIVAGLCFAMARNFKSTVAIGKAIVPPLLFVGGVAANKGMARAFKEIFELNDDEFVIPEHFSTLAAIGSAISSLKMYRQGDSVDLKEIIEKITSIKKEIKGYHKLVKSCKSYNNPERDVEIPNGEKVTAYLGIDIGSVSTNVVAINEESKVLSKRYLPTAGRPINAVIKGLKEVGEEIGDKVVIKGCGTTGSGRYLIARLVGADIVRNEITAQAEAAININRQVDTIFEIGGQDSKFISLSAGRVTDFEMNKACAAGTGSFLEEQAEKLDISIKEEFAEHAFKSASPSPLGERCTVFMESDIVKFQQDGAAVSDISGGLSYAIAHNYLNKVVREKKIGENIFFQGGVAANNAVITAFSQILGKDITVPPHHEVTGAIGVAYLAKKENTNDFSTFKGFNLSDLKYGITTFECRDCSNSCEIRKVNIENSSPLFYGGRCEKFDMEKKKNDIPDLYAEREKILLEEAHSVSEGKTIGIPRILFFHEFLPFWLKFFKSLGLKPVLSESTNKKIARRGIELSSAETCYPVKAALGHIENLLEKGVDYIFAPAFINFPKEKGANFVPKACPYVQSFPSMMKSSFKLKNSAAGFITPVIELSKGKEGLFKELSRYRHILKVSGLKIDNALDDAEKAQKRFYEKLEKLYDEKVVPLLSNGGFIIIGRSYNTCDRGINLGIPSKLKDMGYLSIPIDLIPYSRTQFDVADNMYWKSGQRILSAVKWVKENPQFHPIYITNFGCGPDSFIGHFVNETIKPKRYLEVEIDEHSADAGIITRLEAFIDSIKNETDNEAKIAPYIWKKFEKKYRIYIPPMADHAVAIAASFRHFGFDAEAIPDSDDETVEIGKKYTSGRECYPALLTAGDIIKTTKRADFIPEKTAFFFPSGMGPCRYGQYKNLHRIVLNKAGFENTLIFSPNQDSNFYSEIGVAGTPFIKLTWNGIVAVDILQKIVREFRPYEKNKGEVDYTYKKALKKISEAITADGMIPPEILHLIRNEFNAIQRYKDMKKPLIGAVGEIYIRSNRFSNSFIEEKVESLGCEIWLPPVSEWLLYNNFTSKRHALSNKDYADLLRVIITNFVQKKDEEKIEHMLDGFLRNLKEPTIEKTIEYAKDYLHPAFEGEAILSIGKTIDFIKKGVDGILNLIPFTCMPGTVVTSIFKQMQGKYDLPFLTIAFDGQKGNLDITRLETFIYQAENRMKRQR